MTPKDAVKDMIIQKDIPIHYNTKAVEINRAASSATALTGKCSTALIRSFIPWE
jgi:hypothetical protein